MLRTLTQIIKKYYYFHDFYYMLCTCSITIPTATIHIIPTTPTMHSNPTTPTTISNTPDILLSYYSVYLDWYFQFSYTVIAISV